MCYPSNKLNVHYLHYINNRGLWGDAYRWPPRGHTGRKAKLTGSPSLPSRRALPHPTEAGGGRRAPGPGTVGTHAKGWARGSPFHAERLQIQRQWQIMSGFPNKHPGLRHRTEPQRPAAFHLPGVCLFPPKGAHSLAGLVVSQGPALGKDVRATTSQPASSGHLALLSGSWRPWGALEGHRAQPVSLVPAAFCLDMNMKVNGLAPYRAGEARDT